MKDTLESFIDKHGLAAVLESLARVCYDKANHVAETYNDVVLADAWSKAGVAVENCAERTAVRHVSP